MVGAIAASFVGDRAAEAVTCRTVGRSCAINAHCCSGLCGPRDATGHRTCACPAGTEPCHGLCVDPASAYLADPKNCGACGNRCATGRCRNGVCGKSLGAACATKDECASGHCVDGVCCDGACAGQCQSCAGTGHCTMVTGAPVGGRPACGGSGACVGACDGQHAACVYPGAAASCGTTTCASGAQTSHACDGAGNCRATTTDCGLYACGTSGCLTSCANDGDCAGAAYCTGGVCTADLANGQPCDRRAECRSGHCVDGVCCDAASCPACHACNVGGQAGACAPIADGTACGTNRICCAGTCCGAGGMCTQGACSVTCLAQGQPCTGVAQCCQSDAVACDYDSGAQLSTTVCCSTVGGACVFQDSSGIGQDPIGCCFLADGEQLFCGPPAQDGRSTCGGPGAFCTSNAGCASGSCCNSYCCAAGQQCSSHFCKAASGGSCASDGDCASGLCCNGQCVARNEDHCTSCTDTCPAGRACGNGGCKSPIGGSCTQASDCASGFCYNGVCCDECGGQCGQPQPKGTPCSGGICCSGVCKPRPSGPPEPWACGVCGDETCPDGDICTADRRCTCTVSTTIQSTPGGGCQQTPHTCHGGAGLCVTSTEGNLFCAWQNALDCSRSCATSQDCRKNPPEICLGNVCSSISPTDWICTPDTCCGHNICAVATPLT